MTDITPEHIGFALEPLKYLSRPLSIGSGYLKAAIESCRKKEFEEGIQLCCDLYQLGLDHSDSYTQGVARLAMGSLYFASGDPSNGWENAVDQYKQSVRLFHTQYKQGCDRDEGIAEFALGRLYERQSAVAGRDKWKEAIATLEKSKELICDTTEELFLNVEQFLNQSKEERRRFSMINNVGQLSQAGGANVPPAGGANIPSNVPPPSAPGVVGMGGGAPTGGGGLVPPRGPHGNYAITVACPRKQLKRSFPKPSFSTIILLLAVLCLLGLPVALWRIEELAARMIIIILDVVATLGFLGVFSVLKLRIKIPAGSVGILLSDSSEPKLIDGVFLRSPIGETLYDIVSLGPQEYKCQLEFRERKGTPPVIQQEMRIQYRVIEDQLEQVATQLSGRTEQPKQKHPMKYYWESELSDHLQRYFENMSSTAIEQALDNPRALETDLFNMLRTNAVKHVWGIDFMDIAEDVHLGYYRIEKVGR